MDTVRLLEEFTGEEANLRFSAAHKADVPATWANIEKAGRILAWSPCMSIGQGLRELVNWYRENRGWASEVLTSDS